MLVCLLARVALFLRWPAEFDELSGADIALAFLEGLVFDASIVSIGLAPMIAALIAPFEWAAKPTVRAAAAWMSFATFALLVLISTADVLYFGLVGRHLGNEALSVFDDPALLLSIARDEYGPATLAVAALLAAAAWGWSRAMRWDATRAPVHLPSWAALAAVPLFVLCARGGATGKPLQVVDAFDSGSVQRGYLELNGAFCLTHAMLDRAGPRAEFMPWTTAVASVREQAGVDAGSVLDDEYPLQRTESAGPNKRLNVLVVLLESWDASVVDAIRVRDGLAPLGVTPNVDALAERGLLLTRCYAAGQRSTHGLLAVLAGLPTLPGFPYFGRGIEQSQLAYLGRLAQSEGYSTLLMQGSSEHSFRIDAIAALAGFQDYLGKNAILAAHGAQPMADWGAWDDDLFSVAHERLSVLHEPFAALLFTTSTHVPYQTPLGAERPYPEDSDEHRFWNSVHGSDAALGRFIDSARAAGYLDNTVLVLIADHCSPLHLATADGPDRHHIFGLICAPGLAPGTSREVTSQLDVLPTIADLCGWSAPHAGVGRSIFDADTEDDNGALCVRGDIVLRVEDEGWLEHDLKRRLGTRTWAAQADFDAMETRLLATVQVTARALRKNRVYRPPSAPSSVR